LRRTKYLDEGSVYATDVSTMLEHLDRNERDGIAPETVAATIVDAVISPRPRELYAVGSRAPLPFLLKRILPRGLMSKIVAAQHGLRRGRLRHGSQWRGRLRRERESGYWNREWMRCWVVEMPSSLCWRERLSGRSCWRSSTRASLVRFPRLNTRLTLSPSLAVTSA